MTLPELLSRFEGVKKTSNGYDVKCPAHDDATASLSISESDDHKILLHCHAGCPTEYIVNKLGLKVSDLFSNNGDSRPRMVCAYDYHNRNGDLIFQVVRFQPKSFRQRQSDGKGGWLWKMDGVTRELFRLPQIIKAVGQKQKIFLVEGEKDVLALVEHGLEATCNPGGAGKWQDNYTETLSGAQVVIIADRDAPGRAHAQFVAAKLNRRAAAVKVIEPPNIGGAPVKDAADFFAAAGTVQALLFHVEQCPLWHPFEPSDNDGFLSQYIPNEEEKESPFQPLTLRTPNELLNMTFDDGDIILGDRLLAEGHSMTLCGAGGVGKSRLWIQFMAAQIAGRKFLCFDTFKPDMTWLWLQTENSNRRLQKDFQTFQKWLGDEDWRKFSNQVVIHTLETDEDGLLCLSDRSVISKIQSAIAIHSPSAICIDPLADVAVGDLNKDADMKTTLQILSRLCRTANPNRAIVVLHHALTGRGGAAKATGYDRSSFSRNSKVLFAWTRGQINLAPIDPENNNRLIVSCGKCSNGREFPTFAIKLNLDTMIYECDASVDVSQWEEDMTGKIPKSPMTPDRVRQLTELAGSQKADLARVIMDDCGCSRATAYRHAAKAEKTGQIKFSDNHGKYFKH